MAKKLGLIQNKGGAGKTTSAVNIVGALSVLYPERKIALVGADGQGNAPSAFGLDPNEMEFTMYDVFMGNKEIEDIKIPSVVSPNIDIYPSNTDMNFLEFDDMNRRSSENKSIFYDFIQEFKNDQESLFALTREEFIEGISALETPNDYFNKLHDKLGKLDEEYDYIIFDTPPEIKSVTASIISILDNIIIPFDPDVQTIEGIVNILPRIYSLREQYNPNLKIGGILATKIRSQIKIHAQLTKEVLLYCVNNNIRYLQTEIPQTSKFASTAARTGLPATMVNADDKFVKSYFDLVAELEKFDIL